MASLNFGPIQITVLVTSFYFFGFFFGILAVCLFYLIFIFILKRFGLQLVSGGDLTMFYETHKGIHNVEGIIMMEKMTYESVRTRMLE